MNKFKIAEVFTDIDIITEKIKDLEALIQLDNYKEDFINPKFLNRSKSIASQNDFSVKLALNKT